MPTAAPETQKLPKPPAKPVGRPKLTPFDRISRGLRDSADRQAKQREETWERERAGAKKG